MDLLPGRGGRDVSINLPRPSEDGVVGKAWESNYVYVYIYLHTKIYIFNPAFEATVQNHSFSDTSTSLGFTHQESLRTLLPLR